ncbi:MAG: type II CAAX endopeptidase family protein [Gemmatimonadetes bacterium]|nr:type II CAAX endopeptidase family protein [Gemmatimonadota bacterium]
MSPRVRGAAVALVGIGAVATAVALFPRAFPTVALNNTLTTSIALARADSFFSAHDLAPAATRRATRFRSDDSLLTYVDLAAGGTDSVNAIVRGSDAALFVWTVRAFEPTDVHEARVDIAPDGRIIGFQRKLAESDTLPDVGADSAQTLALHVMTNWLGEPPSRWTLATSSYETRKTSERVDRTFTFERTDRMIGAAPLRLDVVIAGDLPVQARPYVYIPESFNRRYDEMRSANELLSLFSTVGTFALLFLGFWAIRKHSRAGDIRWREPIIVGAVIGAFLTAAGVNGLGAPWFAYDTAMPAGIFQAIVLATAVAGGVLTGGVVTLTLAAAEGATRSAFPEKLDWWALWRVRGTREVAEQVAGGYVVAAIALAYVAGFYVVTRGLFGWWVPSSLFDDPNQIATPAPWITGIALSLQAGVWEEALFRALPLSLFSLWVGNRPHRGWWLAGGVVATALVFGFAHSSYPSWPPYSRGVEIFLDACFWGVLFLRFGFLVTVLAHFAYDVVLFSLFAATGSAPEYRIAAAVATLALLAPAIAVAWKAFRQGGLTPTPHDARFGAWKRAEPAVVTAEAPVPATIGAMSARSRQLAVLAAVAALALAIGVPRKPVRGPQFTAGRAVALAVADSLVVARGVSTEGWRRLTATASDTVAGWPRFLTDNDSDSLAPLLAPTYAVPAWWVVRYVHTEGTLADRAEEWRVRVFPDGRPLDVRHIVADSAPGAAPPPDSARRIARLALARAGIDTLRLREVTYEETQRPNRRDATVTWTDTTVPLPAGASARAWVTLAGTDVLVARRGVELPEAFYRSERERSTRTLAIAALFGALLFGTLVTAIIFVGRKRERVVTDRVFGSVTARAVLAVLAATTFASSLNSWPAMIFSYDTSAPWSTHLTEAVLGVALSLLAALMLVGIWMLMEMLRTRAGIRAWPEAGAPAARRDAMVAGVGLGAVFMVNGLLPSLAGRTPVAGEPTTSLNDVFPFIDSVLAIPSGVAVMVSVTAIPLLTILALSRERRTRWLLAALFLALGVGIVAPNAMSARLDGFGATEALLSVATGLTYVLALRWWAPRGAFTWLVAALTVEVCRQLRDATHAVGGAELSSALLALVAAMVAIAWVARQARAQRG